MYNAQVLKLNVRGMGFQQPDFLAVTLEFELRFYVPPDRK